MKCVYVACRHDTVHLQRHTYTPGRFHRRIHIHTRAPAVSQMSNFTKVFSSSTVVEWNAAPIVESLYSSKLSFTKRVTMLDLPTLCLPRSTSFAVTLRLEVLAISRSFFGFSKEKKRESAQQEEHRQMKKMKKMKKMSRRRTHNHRLISNNHA
jgi:hypothetical protein